MNKAYQRMLPILQLANCRCLRRKEIDKRLLAIENHEVFQQLKSLFEECPKDYWENLTIFGDANDLILLNQRKTALRKMWRACYGNAKGNKTSHSTD